VTKREIREAADTLETWIGRIDASELEATAFERERLVGAVAALRALAERRPTDLRPSRSGGAEKKR
jgi:hypothetical protein